MDVYVGAEVKLYEPEIKLIVILLIIIIYDFV